VEGAQPQIRHRRAIFGYDISDYTDIDPQFGTIDQFDELLTVAHARGLKLLLDLVPNHTSDQHPWFRETRSSRGNPKRDWYIWRGPPLTAGRRTIGSRNSAAALGNSTGTRSILLSRILARAAGPDWRNPDVRAAIHNVMRFWLERGVDGFRVDVIWHLMKDPLFRDNPLNLDYRESRS
jgi:alpha-glucosidase